MTRNQPGSRLSIRVKPVAAALALLFAQQADAGGGVVGGYFPPQESGRLDWAYDISGDWFEPFYWLPNHNEVPGPDKIAAVYGTGNPVLNGEATVLDFYQWGSSTLSGTGTLHSGGLSWLSGTQSGGGGLVVNGDAMLGVGTGYATLDLENGRSLTLNGNTTFQTYWLGLSNGSAIHNNGSFTSLGERRNGVVYDNSLLNVGSGNAFNNNAGFVQDAQGHATTVGMAFNNRGTVQVRSGKLRLIGGGNHLGSFEVLAGQAMELAGDHDFHAGYIQNDGLVLFNGGTSHIDAQSGYAGLGTLQVNAGVLVLGVPAGATVERLKLSGGRLEVNAGLGQDLALARMEQSGGAILGGTAQVRVGELSWTSGRMAGVASTRVNGLARLGDGNGYAALYLDDGRTLALAGDSQFQAAFLALGGASTLDNTGSFTSRGDRRGAAVYDSSIVDYNANSTFNNLGGFVQDADGHVTTINTAFNNRGTVRVQSGTLKLNRGGSHGGAFQVLSGQALEFGGGVHDFTGASGISNAGTLKFSGGTTHLGQNVAYTGNGTLHVAGATLNLSNPGILTPGQLRISSGVANLESGIQANQLTLSGGKLAGAGQVRAVDLAWSGGAMTGTGTTRAAGAASLGDGNSYANLILDGRKLVLEGSATFQAFQLSMSNGAILDNQGVFTNRGDVRGATVADNVIAHHDIGAQSVINNAGSFVQDAAGHTLTIGTLFNNSGEVRVESGRLVFNNAFNQLGDASVLNLAVSGLVNDSLDINATAQLDGTLSLRFLGYTPALGEEIQVFGYNGHNGSFDRVSALGLDAGLTLTPIYGATGFSVQVAAVPEPETWAMLLAGLGLVGLRMRRSAAGHVVAKD